MTQIVQDPTHSRFDRSIPVSSLMTEESDRRRHPRITLDRPCKVFEPKLGRYIAGRTWDVSSGGAMIETDRPLELVPGQKLYLGVAMKRRDAILHSADMLEVKVVRSLTMTDNRTAIAVELVNPVAVPVWSVARAA